MAKHNTTTYKPHLFLNYTVQKCFSGRRPSVRAYTACLAKNISHVITSKIIIIIINEYPEAGQGPCISFKHIRTKNYYNLIILHVTINNVVDGFFPGHSVVGPSLVLSVLSACLLYTNCNKNVTNNTVSSGVTCRLCN